MNRVKFLSKITLTASLLLALVLTVSCSSNKEEEETTEQDPPINPQIYNLDGSPYAGSGTIELSGNYACDGGNCTWTGLNVGSAANGIITLNLPENVPAEFLGNFSDAFKGCNTDVKVFSGDVILTNDSREYLGKLTIGYMDKTQEETGYIYFSKAEKITCESQQEGYKIVFNMNVKKGWNRVYIQGKVMADNSIVADFTTNNILTKELTWLIIK